MMIPILFALSLAGLVFGALFKLHSLLDYKFEGSAAVANSFLVVMAVLAAFSGFRHMSGLASERDGATGPRRSPRGFAFGITLLVTGLFMSGLAFLDAVYVLQMGSREIRDLRELIANPVNVITPDILAHLEGAEKYPLLGRFLIALGALSALLCLGAASIRRKLEPNSGAAPGDSVLSPPGS